MSESNANPLPLASSLSRDLDVLNPLLWLEFAEFQAGFLARSAHELRSPISSLMSCQQLILNDLCDSPEEERSCLQTAYEATQRLLTMLDTLVTISKLKIGKIQPERQRILLRDLLDEIYAMTHLAIANQNAKLEIEALPDPALAVEGDPFVLRQLFPIIVNAILPDLSAGTVWLKLSLETSQSPTPQQAEQQRVKLQIHGQQPFQTLQAALRDNSDSDQIRHEPVSVATLEQQQQLKTQLLDAQADAPGLAPQFSPTMQLLILKQFLLYTDGHLDLEALTTEGALAITLPLASP